ncbi:MAG: hypothetical protein Q7U07_01390, partial [Gammaproteobacteria bacterium]|nr:hypothetical protein [Gammaproteobacteria bacterium]
MTSVTQGTPPALVDQSLALGVYLESLLCESPQAVMHSAGHSVRAPVSTVADPSPVITAAPAPP